MSQLHLLIVTQGDAIHLARTLTSLEGSRLPANVVHITVVENGTEPRCRIITRRPIPGFELRYQFLPGLDKAGAMNVALETVPDEALIVCSSNEVRFHSETLIAYDRASRTSVSGEFFGGPFLCDYESMPPQWVISRLPLAFTGWQPSEGQIEPTRSRFFGFNWAAFCRDIKRLGGYGLRSEAQEVTCLPFDRRGFGIQRRMLASGMLARYVPKAIVTRYIPEHRCTIDWTIERARQDGIDRGLSRRDRAVPEIALHHWSNTVGLLASTAVTWMTSPRWAHQLHFRARYHQQQAIGYFQGFRSGFSGREAAYE